jgi:serine protease Do
MPPGDRSLVATGVAAHNAPPLERADKKVMWLRILRAGACGLILGAALLTGPATAREVVPASQAELIRGLIPSVVNITVRIAGAAAPDQALMSANQPASNYRTAVGSGFVIDPSGQIVTNWHVVSDAFEIIVSFSDGTRLPAHVVGAWRVIDLALLKVDAGHPLHAVNWGDSSTLQIGDPVLAMGNAFGVGLSVSAGIVSALNRNIEDSVADNMIQTDAAINHGNSGGPLFNLKGEVVGVNSTIISPTPANSGLGFAIPSNDVQFAIKRMGNMPDSERPGWLGAKIQAVTPEMAEAMGQRLLHGAIVAWVLPDQPAAKAGLLEGDVILRVDERTVTDERALLREITERKPGEMVTFTVWRNGQEIERKVTLDTWPESIWERNAAPPPPEVKLTVPPHLGLTVVQLTDDLRAANAVASDTKGVLVTEVAAGSDAAQQGVAAGDLVLQVGPTRVKTPDELWREVDLARSKGRRFGLFRLLSKIQPVAISQFPGPKWITLPIASD